MKLENEEKCTYCREYGNLPCDECNKKLEAKKAMDKTKYFIDLSKCSDEQRKHIFSLLPEPIIGNQYDITNGDFKLHFVGNIWLVLNDHEVREKTELTYPEFIKLFEGGERKTLRQQFESEITTKGAEFLFDSNNQNYIMWLENKINSKQ